jgi:hypothetical protein
MSAAIMMDLELIKAAALRNVLTVQENSGTASIWLCKYYIRDIKSQYGKSWMGK